MIAGGGCRECAPSPSPLRWPGVFLIQLVFWKKKTMCTPSTEKTWICPWIGYRNCQVSHSFEHVETSCYRRCDSLTLCVSGSSTKQPKLLACFLFAWQKKLKFWCQLLQHCGNKPQTGTLIKEHYTATGERGRVGTLCRQSCWITPSWIIIIGIHQRGPSKLINCMKLNLPLPLQPEWSVLLDVSCEIPQIQGEGNRPWYRHLGQEMPLGLPWQSGLWSDRFPLQYQVAGIPVDT